MSNTLSKYIPDLGLNLAKYSGAEVIERIGEDIIREVVTSILCGGNVRSLTEGLTQRRISLSNAALLIAYLRASKEIKNFPEQLAQVASSELKGAKIKPEQRVFLQWLIGLTGKSIQNVLRGDSSQVEAYLRELESAVQNSVNQSKEEFGDLNGTVTVGSEVYDFNWKSLLQIFTGIGAQTLALRGAEKSMYGKLFEKLILGSVLSMLDFELIDHKISTKAKSVFWLSQRESKRESDATLLYKPGVGVRFDIGFIGPGNTEISLDKVSRFEREMEFGQKQHTMSTIIVIDRIGEGSRIADLAKNIDGNIVQMSMSYWVKEIAEILQTRLGFKHEILKLTNEESLDYIMAKMAGMDLLKFTQK